jgi:hypothetical protein
MLPFALAPARTGRASTTNKFIAEPEVVQPWGSSGVSAPLAMPKNAATGRGYSGSWFSPPRAIVGHSGPKSRILRQR